MERYTIVDEVDGTEVGRVFYDVVVGILLFAWASSYDSVDQAWDHLVLLRGYLRSIAPPDIALGAVVICSNAEHDRQSGFLEPSCVVRSEHLDAVYERMQSSCHGLSGESYTRLHALLRAHHLILVPSSARTTKKRTEIQPAFSNRFRGISPPEILRPHRSKLWINSVGVANLGRLERRRSPPSGA